MPVEATQAERRYEDLYARSVAEAEVSGHPEYIEFHDDHLVIAAATRGQAKQFFAGEYGCEFVEVSAKRVYMRIDFQAIKDVAHDMAADGAYEDEDLAGDIAYTWECEGWVWEYCAHGDDRAVAFWECTLLSASRGGAGTS